MKTDRFTDSIRRKLESIRPEFTENDWAKMQTTLHQATPPRPDAGSAPSGHSFTGSSWFGQPFMMAAAAVSTVLLVAFSVWQRHEINQLRQTVTQLSQQPNRLPETPAFIPGAEKSIATNTKTPRQAYDGITTSVPTRTANQASESLPTGRSTASSPTGRSARSDERNARPDTVYVTRYVAIPTRPSTLTNEELTRRTGTPTGIGSERNEAVRPATLTTNKGATGTESDASGTASSEGIDSRPVITSRSGRRESADGFGTNGMAGNGSERVNAGSSMSLRSTHRKPTKRRYTTERNTDRDGVETRSAIVSRPTRRNRDQSAKETGRGGDLTDQGVSNPLLNIGDRSVETASTAYAMATNRPPTLGAKDWNKALVRRARSMHSTQVMLTEGQQPPQPLSQPVNPLTVQVRAGVGGEVSSGLWSMGVFSELLLGKNWTLGLGILSKADYSAGTFRSDHDFDEQTHHDFRQYYTRGIGPKIDIQNIDTRTVRMQIPISIGYRVPINRTLTFLPTISTYLTLRNTETVSFYYRDQPFGPSFKAANFQMDRPVDPFTSFTIGTSLEYHKGHWAAQAGPMLTMPLQETMNWQNRVTAGLRVRAFYQF